MDVHVKEWTGDVEEMENQSVKNRSSVETLLSLQENFPLMKLNQIWSPSKRHALEANCSRSYDFYQKLPSAPQSSPIQFPDGSPNSRHCDNFETELLKACLTELSGTTTRKQANTEDSAAETASFSCCSNITPGTSSNNGINPSEEVLSELEYSSRLRLESAMSDINSNIDRSSQDSDKTSIIAHHGSDVSDISFTDTETSSLDEDVWNIQKPEGQEKVDMEIQSFQWEICSPRKPRSPMSEFLNRRKHTRKQRKRMSSVNAICCPIDVKEREGGLKFKFLQTV